jgi:hypothetical protein
MIDMNHCVKHPVCVETKPLCNREDCPINAKNEDKSASFNGYSFINRRLNKMLSSIENATGSENNGTGTPLPTISEVSNLFNLIKRHVTDERARSNYESYVQKLLALRQKKDNQLKRNTDDVFEKSARIKEAYVRHMPGHKNSKGEASPWVILDHNGGKILSSHKSESEAKKHLQQMHIFKNSQSIDILVDEYHKNG